MCKCHAHEMILKESNILNYSNPFRNGEILINPLEKKIKLTHLFIIYNYSAKAIIWYIS